VATGAALLACTLLGACTQTADSGTEVTGDSNFSGSGGLFSSSGSDAYAQARQECLDSINAFRATESLPPLERWTAQESCADNQSRLDSESGTATGAFGACGELGQSECPGRESLDGCLRALWSTGQELYRNGDYTKVACGFYETPSGEFWHVQNFQ
jgi:hypothetical protein